MADPLDHLEVAKLATYIGSQLKAVDKQTDGSNIQSNRIDTNRFIRNVVQAADPNAGRGSPVRPGYSGVSSDEEARLLAMLNNAALSQVPDVSQHSPQLIPMEVGAPQQPAAPYSPPPLPTTPLVASSPVSTTDTFKEISDTLKSIDGSLKSLCDVFVVKAKKKKKRNLVAKRRKTTSPILSEEVSQNSTTPNPIILPNAEHNNSDT
jgi:hypothetical protein